MENQSEMKPEESVSSGPVLHCTFCNRPLWDEERGCNVIGMYYVSHRPSGPCVKTCLRCGHVFLEYWETTLRERLKLVTDQREVCEALIKRQEGCE
jgi:hypothetical protein